MVDYNDNHHSTPFSTMVPSSFPSSDCLVFRNESEPSPTDYKALVLVGCGCKSATELLSFIHERRIEKVDLTWADEMGLWHHAIIPVSEINSESALIDGLYVRSGENMLFLRPDPSSAKMSPFSQPFLLHLTCEDISHITAGNAKHSFTYRPNHVNPYSQTHPYSQHIHNFSARSRSQSRGVEDGGGTIHHTGHYNHSLDPSGFYDMLPYEFGEINSKRSQSGNNNNNNNNNNTNNSPPTHLNNGNQHPMNASWASMMSQQLLQTCKRSPEMGGEGGGSSDEEVEITNNNNNNNTRVILPHPTSTKKWVPDTNRRGEEKGNVNNNNNNNSNRSASVDSVFVPSWTPTTTKKPAQKAAGVPASPNTPPSPNTPHLTSGINSSAPPSSPSSNLGDSPPLSPNPENLSRKKGSNHNNNNNNNSNNNNSKTFTFVNSDSPTSSPILSGANSQQTQLSASTLNSKTQSNSITISSGGSTIILPGPPVVPGVPGTAMGDGPVIVNGYVLPPVLRPRQYHACKKSGVNTEAKAGGKTLKESTLLKEDEDESSDFDIGKRKPNDLIGQNPFCRHCGATNTPEWRRGPNGTKSLCNACGLHYSKLVKREALVPLKPLGSLKEQMSINALLN